MKKVSVIIPSYNHYLFIGDAINSVFNQEVGSLSIELIVIDDGSKDESLKLLRNITNPNFILIEQENKGAHIAINRGLDLANGEYIAILNSDDIFYPERLKKCIEYMVEKNADLVSTWLDVIDSEGNLLGVKRGWHNMLPWEFPKEKNNFSMNNSFSLNLVMSNFVSTTSNMVFKKSLVHDIGGMKNFRFAHDWEFLFRASAKHRCVQLPESLMKYRIHGSNTISSNREWMLFEILIVLALGIKRIRKDHFFPNLDISNISKFMECMYNSINLQGHEKSFIILNQFIESMNEKDTLSVEDVLLNDLNIRKLFIDFIREEECNSKSMNISEPNSSRFNKIIQSILRKIFK